MAQRLAFEERATIEAMTNEGFSAERIAQTLGRAASTVRRETARCERVRYSALDAQADADAAAARPRTCKLAADSGLAAEVAEMLAEGCSPHAVAGLMRAQGRPPGRRVCAETIYAACYDPAGGRGLAAGSWRCLVRCRRRRKRRGRCEQARRGPLGQFRPLSERPAAVEGRCEAGHWEGDLIIGARNRSAVVTLVERTSRYTLLGALHGGYSADKVASAVAATFARVPSGMAKTLTWDRGSEMARWPLIEADTGLEVYFCEPHSPWQRPTNEQNNSVLRRRLPKGTDLDVGQARLWAIEDRINTMPRRLHHWHNAQDRYTALASNHH